MLTNNSKLAKQVLEHLGLNAPKKFKTMWNVPEHIPNNEKMVYLGNYYKKETTILVLSELVEGDWIPKVFKTDWRIARQLVNEQRDIIIFFGEKDYIRFKQKRCVRIGNGMSKILEEMIGRKQHPIHLAMKEMGYDYRPYLKLFKTNPKFVGMIENIFSNMEVSGDIVKDIMYPKDIDHFMFKVLNVLWLVKTKDPIYIKEFRGNPNDRYKGIDPEFEVKTFLDTLKQFTGIEIDINLIYIEVEENYLSEEVLDTISYDSTKDDRENPDA